LRYLHYCPPQTPATLFAVAIANSCSRHFPFRCPPVAVAKPFPALAIAIPRHCLFVAVAINVAAIAIAFFVTIVVALVQQERSLVKMSVQYLVNLGWYSLDLGVVQRHVRNDGLD
jgi:hypothetical protein